MFNIFKKQQVVGIDISDYSIEALRLNRDWSISAYNRILLDEGVVQDGKIVKKEVLAEKLKELLNGITPRSSRAILSLPESKIFIHYFEASLNLKGEELKKNIFEEASKIIPLDQGRIYWDYIAVPGKDSQHIVYIGTLKEVVDEYIEALHSAMVNVVAVDIESLSLSRALLGRSFLKGSAMIIDIGARTTNVSIFNRDGMLALSVTIPVAGNHFTKAIAEKLKMKIEEAEALKIKSGFDDKQQDNKVLSILQMSFQGIIKDTKEAIAHYENSSGDKIEEIILAGGSALLPKVDEYLSVNLGKKVAVGDPFKQIKDSQSTDKKYSPILFANVVGLALRGMGDTSRGINLLQQMPRSKKVGEEKSRSTKLQISMILQNIRKSPTLTASFVIIAFAILGFVLYKYVYNPPIRPRESPVTTEAEPSPESKTPATTTVSPKQELLPETEKSGIITKTKVIIQNTPTGWLNVREGPGVSYAKIARVNQGEIYTILEEKDKWYKIKIDEKTEGWITSKYAIKQ